MSTPPACSWRPWARRPGGRVVGFADLIPQLIGAPGLLDPIQHLSIAMVAFTAGLGFDAKFHRVLPEAESLPVSVPR